jgi:hypothetical protein
MTEDASYRITGIRSHGLKQCIPVLFKTAVSSIFCISLDPFAFPLHVQGVYETVANAEAVSGIVQLFFC